MGNTNLAIKYSTSILPTRKDFKRIFKYLSLTKQTLLNECVPWIIIDFWSKRLHEISEIQHGMRKRQTAKKALQPTKMLLY